MPPKRVTTMSKALLGCDAPEGTLAELKRVKAERPALIDAAAEDAQALQRLRLRMHRQLNAHAGIVESSW